MKIPEYLQKLNPAEFIKNKPDWAKVPIEMLPVWTAVLIPHWMPAVQGIIATGIHEGFYYVPDAAVGLITVGLFTAMNALTLYLEYKALSEKKYVTNPVTTVAHWTGLNNQNSVIAGNLAGWACSVFNFTDWASVVSRDPRILNADIIAKSALALFIFGGMNLLILFGQTEAVGKKIGELSKKITKGKVSSQQ